MRIYSGQYNLIARDIIRELRKKNLIDVGAEEEREAELDVVGVLKEYNRTNRQITQRARDMTEGSGRSAEMRMRRRLARDRSFKIGDDALDYVVDQVIETFVQSVHVEEIFGTDRELRAAITPIIDRYTQDRESELDEAVRSRLKNLEEGSAAWDIEYERVLDRVKRTRGLDEPEEG